MHKETKGVAKSSVFQFDISVLEKTTTKLNSQAPAFMIYPPLQA